MVVLMGRNAKRIHRGFADFTPTAADVDLVVEVFELPGYPEPYPVVAARPQSDLGATWLTPERRQDLVRKAQAVVYGPQGTGDFDLAICQVVTDAMADGLVVAVTADGESASLVWDKRTAPRTREGCR
jgi:hypothetical protein